MAVDDHRFGERCQQFLCDVLRLRQLRTLEQDGELVAAEAGNGVTGAHRMRRAPADLDEYLVADAVSQAVIDVLELVEVAEEDAERHRVRSAWLQCMGEPVGEQLPIRQAGQRIVERLMGQLGLEIDPGGDVADGDDQALHRRVSHQVGDRSLDVQQASVRVAHPYLQRPVLAFADGAQLAQEHLTILRRDEIEAARPEQGVRVPSEHGRRRRRHEGRLRVKPAHEDDVSRVADERRQALLALRPQLLGRELLLQRAVPRDEPAKPHHPAERREDQQTGVDQHRFHVEPVLAGLQGRGKFRDGLGHVGFGQAQRAQSRDGRGVLLRSRFPLQRRHHDSLRAHRVRPLIDRGQQSEFRDDDQDRPEDRQRRAPPRVRRCA